MKKLYLFAALATMLAACSENDLTAEKQVVQQNAEEDAIVFDVYTSRSTTRAGSNGPLTTEALKTLGFTPADNKKGFGVFAYYTNGESYTGSSKPDFMYNQNVYWNGANVTTGSWTYSPIKYWPNEFGDDAISDQVDKVTLFAYAPWVDVKPLTGLVTAAAPNNALNITGMTRNNATGDPFIKYTASMISDNSVDLCYGVAAQHFVSSNSAYNKNDIQAGSPYIDVVKPGIDANSKIKFDFRHALAQLNVTIDAVVNAAEFAGGIAVDATNTRIWVRSVTFEGITQTGALNLNSTAESPNWYDVNGTSRITSGSLTVYDGRKDGREANETAASETPATLNTKIVQSKKYDLTGTGISATTPEGVVKEKMNLFRYTGNANPAVNDPVFVIPTYEKMKVTIVYDVETYDENLASYLSDGATRGSTIENRISKTIDAFGNIEAGKHYTLNLHLGMRTVDFEAAVTEWVDVQAPVDLPSNLQTFLAKETNTGEAVIPWDATEYHFAVSGLAPNLMPTVKNVTLTSGSSNVSPANGSGVANVDITGISTLNKTTLIDQLGTAEIGDGTNKVTVTIKRSAHPLGLNNLQYVAGSPNKLTYSITAEGVLTNTNAIKNSTNGIVQVFQDGEDITTQCTLSGAGHEITLPSAAADGTIFKVYMKANDAAAESATCTVH